MPPLLALGAAGSKIFRPPGACASGGKQDIARLLKLRAGIAAGEPPSRQPRHHHWQIDHCGNVWLVISEMPVRSHPAYCGTGRGNDMRDEGAKAVAGALGGLPHLKKLDLWCVVQGLQALGRFTISGICGEGCLVFPVDSESERLHMNAANNS